MKLWKLHAEENSSEFCWKVDFWKLKKTKDEKFGDFEVIKKNKNLEELLGT